MPTSLDDRDLQLFLAQKRARLKRLSGNALSAIQRAAMKRFVRSRIRAIMRTLKNTSRHPIAVDILAFRRRDSSLVDALCPARNKSWVHPVYRKGRLRQQSIVLKDFSFVDRPVHALEVLHELVKAEATALNLQLHFEDQHCLDVAPYLLMSMMWPNLAPVFSGGRITTEIQKVIEAVRLRRPLKMGAFRFADNDDDVSAFPVQSRRGADTTRSATRYLDPQTREKVQDRFADSISNWLESVDRELTRAGRGWITSLIGEVLDNAERHSQPTSMDGDWSMAGFMARREGDDGEPRYYCSIAFISIGTTISESLDTSPPEVADSIDAYVRRHARSTRAELLRTVMAVQDGITRVAASFQANRGGTGLQDILDFVELLGGTERPGCEPKVTIVSGNACILLRRPYLTGKRAGGDSTEPREIWFNSNNSRTDPPDPQHVFSMPYRLPGTLIALSFVLDKEYLDGVGHGKD